MDLVCFELYSPTGKTMITYYVKLPKQEAQVVLDRGLPTKKNSNLFQGTSNDVPEERQRSYKYKILSAI